MFGAYVSDISCSVAWGGEGGSCQMTLVEDPPNQIQISLPPVGTPVSFQHGAFYFGGIFQRYTYKGSISGRFYDVIIESPAKLLDGIQVILDDFNGRVVTPYNRYYPESAELFTNQILNVYNVYAEVESQKGFGNSFVNSSGFPAYSLLTTLQTLMNGGGQFGGRATFGSYQYGLDISQIITAFEVAKDYRIKGPVQSLASIISECCEAAGLDYFVELTGGGAGNTIASPVIRLRTINRSTSSGRGQVAKLVLSAGNLVSGDVGEEFALPVTQKLVIGGPVSRWVPHEVSNSIPLWGKFSNGQYIYTPGVTTPTVYNFPDFLIPVALDEYSGVISYNATLFELRMAMGGKETWETFKMFQTASGSEPNGFNNVSTAPWIGKAEITSQVIGLIQTGRFVSSDAEPTSLSAAQKRLLRDLQEQSDLIFAAVSKVASNFYGQMFLMPLKLDQQVRYIQDDIQYEAAWDIVDSAFHPETLYNDIAFYDGEGRLRGVAEWPTNPLYDYSGLGGEWALSVGGGIATTKGGPEKELYYIGGQPYVVVKSGAQVPYYDSLTTADFGIGVLAYKFFGVFLSPNTYLTSGGNNLHMSIPPAMTYPNLIGIPQQSNIYSWGPWWAWEGGAVGKSEIVMDESLKPETFGGYDVLDLVGIAKATTGTSEAVPLETGSVQVVGQPTFNLADQIEGSAYISGIDIKVDASGETVTYKFSSWTAQFGRLSSANIDRIAKIYKGNLALAQRNRSQIEKRPLPKIKFEKSELGDSYKGRDNAQSESPVFIHSYMNEVLGGI